MRFTLCFVIGLLLSGNALAQTSRTKCGFYAKSALDMESDYNTYYQHLGVKEGERVASVGAAGGSVELIIASIVQDVNWTLQDIDTSCLNLNVFNQFLQHNEKLLKKKIAAEFEMIIGEVSDTHLPRTSYDRILLINVFHELTERKSMMEDIKGALKPDGVVAIQERMATKKRQRHGDCGHLKLMEADFIQEMNTYGFVLESKVEAEQVSQLYYYIFKQE